MADPSKIPSPEPRDGLVTGRYQMFPFKPGRCSYYCAAIIPRSCNMTSFTCEWPFSANPSDAPAKKDPAIKSEKYTKAMDYNPYKDEGCGFLYGWHKVATYFQVSASPPCSQWRCVFYVIARFFSNKKPSRSHLTTIFPFGPGSFDVLFCGVGVVLMRCIHPPKLSAKVSEHGPKRP